MSRSTQAGEAYEQLKARIESGELHRGEQLTEARVSELLSIGRGPARESLLRLETEGLIHKSGPHGRRYVQYVEDRTPWELRQQYDLREVVDGLAARSAAWHMTGIQIRRLRTILDQIHASIERDDIDGRIDALKQFYETLRYECGNPLVLRAIHAAGISTLYVREKQLDRRLLDAINDARTQGVGLVDVVEAISTHEPEAAEQRMRAWTRTLADAICHELAES